MTDRVLRAIENPHVDILGHPTGRMLLKRQAVSDRRRGGRRRGGARTAWRSRSTASRPARPERRARAARARSRRPIVISSDAHSRQALGFLRWGVGSAPRLARAGATS